MSEMIEFVANLSLDKCKSRLESRHENFTLLALRGQTRIAVKVRPVEPNTYKFSLRRVGKSSPFDWAASGEFSGYLRGLTSEKTAVVGQQKLNWFSLVFSEIVMIMISFGMLLGFVSDGTANRDNILFFVLGAGVINVVLIGWSYIWMAGHAREMQNIVTRLLGQDYDFGSSFDQPWS